MNSYLNSILEREIERQFFQSLDYHGIKYKPFNPAMDGEIHRFATIDGKKGNQDGAYKIHLDGTANWYAEDWRKRIKYKGIFDPSYLSDSDCREYEEQIKQHHTPKAKQEQAQKRKEEEQRQKEKEATAVKSAWSEYQNALGNNLDTQLFKVSAHEYVKKKGLNPQVLCIWRTFFPCTVKTQYRQGDLFPKGTLLIPLINPKTFKFMSLQGIWTHNGEIVKRFYRNAPIKGAVYLISNGMTIHDRKLTCQELIITEGVATGVSVFEMLSSKDGIFWNRKPVICALSCNALLPIAKTMREIVPNAKITIAADNDTAGIAAAIECLECGVADSVKRPEEYKNDWNDWNVRRKRNA